MKFLSSLLLISILFFVKNDELDNLPMNRIQVIGSHNSYKKAIDPALFKVLQRKDSVSVSKIDYEHVSIIDQLDMGLLNLEIDIYADEKGGKYANPKGLSWAEDQKDFDPDGTMKAPGFKIFHMVDIDFRSHYLTFSDFLQALKKWSEAHPDHNPVFVTMEAKDDASKNAELTVPEKFSSKTFDEVDKALIEYLGKEHLIVPDMVRGKYATLEEAVLKANWPTLKQARGKFVFILDDKGSKRDMYIAGHPSLKGRVLFANADPGTPEAAILFRNDSKLTEIKDLVEKGYIIRTRADADTQQARNNDNSNFIAACNSGAQIITTDYYLKSTHFKSDYVVNFEGKAFFRINPVFKQQ
ncbi:Phosphoinositide phospholipase C, Ca2+-dependent [Dyadobacter koreensis]|uniref:Phosphoinositide phospholipase C, Ca2+-dependent n=1 Tax=Dyadobacter koreensis TaxID=408657 RepID=A0A1H6WSB8_9BACT|nr:phosphatidylinositol-specific phospholipase C1-like protein [Dyadobacter koreensis]SEJ19708.1 Phosphoinositide phospholipase C, Ca2+-dependent [Dyadobacter koreensis]